MKIKSLDTSKDFTLKDNIFKVAMNSQAVYQSVVAEMNNVRQGTSSSKNRSLVSGGGKKPFRQKGTGNARQGSSKPPHFRGGATSMGPVNRDHSISMNKKEKILALKSALSSKMSEDNIIFIDSFEIDTHKTKNLHSKLTKFKFKTALFVYGDEKLNENFKKASSNLPGVASLSHKGINVKDLISFEKIFIEEKSLVQISERLL